jgi:hypothetical protein
MASPSVPPRTRGLNVYYIDCCVRCGRRQTFVIYTLGEAARRRIDGADLTVRDNAMAIVAIDRLTVRSRRRRHGRTASPTRSPRNRAHRLSAIHIAGPFVYGVSHLWAWIPPSFSR